MSDLKPIRNISIALDITKSVQPANAFFIYRGDNVRFGFTFYDGDGSLSVENGATIRIFAKKIQKNGKLDLNSSPLFAKDQNYTSSETSVFIDVSSAETAGEAGHYALCIMVFNSGTDSTIRTTQLVYFDLLENGYAGSYQPAEDFRDEVLNALQQTIDAEARAEAFFNDSVENIQNEADHIILALNTSIEEETAKAKAEVESAGVNAVGDVNTAKADAKTELAAAKDAALNDIDQKGASYQEGINLNNALANGAVRVSKAGTSTMLIPRADYPYGYDLWKNTSGVARATAKFTVIGKYLPISGEWTLFAESNGEMYENSVCCTISEDRKTLHYFRTAASGWVYDSVEVPQGFKTGDIISFVYDSANAKIYRNKELIADVEITDSSWLSGNLYMFVDVLSGINYKQNFLLSVGNAFPLTGGIYSISDFVDGVAVPDGLLTESESFNAPLADATGLTLTQITATYSQSFEGETCAKLVPSGLSSTTKRTRYWNAKAPYTQAKNTTAKVRFKFYLPSSNANWKYVRIYNAIRSMEIEETSNIRDENGCVAASDGWREIEFISKTGTSAGAFRFLFMAESAAATSDAQAISSAANDAFYLSEFSVEYPPAIDCYVETPTQNNLFKQKGVISRDLRIGQGWSNYVSFGEEISVGDTGADTVISTSGDENLTGNPYLHIDSFDSIPVGKYMLKQIILVLDTALSDGETLSVGALNSSWKSKEFTAADATGSSGNTFVLESSAPDIWDLRGDAYWGLSIYSSLGQTIMGKVKFIWERIN